ncbi:DUF4252 domain-containing protein [Dysgonomonas sp. ZJ709]|uniref:DUF4252 domain-containing protein n=1 Tax=Dysgonomonas sp. ZJ709 TaxID=2709797 RepID=UPI0013ECFF63|nr:DUF4252 domain-containing protein [Dysgonomonas sp. ZJ709]
MKIKHLFILTTLLLCSAFSQIYAKDVFKNIAKIKGIEMMNLSGEMLASTSSNGINAAGASIDKIFSKIDEMQMYISHDETVTQKIRKEVAHFSKDKDYRSLLNLNTQNGDVLFLFKAGKKDSRNEFIIVAGDIKEYYVIRLTGRFSYEEVQNILNEEEKGETENIEEEEFIIYDVD